MLKNLSIKLGTLKTILVVYTVLSILTSVVTAKACFCGEACLHSPQSNSKTSKGFPFHHRCLGTHCKSCNLENGQTLQAASSFAAIDILDIFDTCCAKLALTEHPSASPATLYFCPQDDVFIKAPSSKIYILNLTLLT